MLAAAAAPPVWAAQEMTKEETVYVVTEADGSQSDVTVSDHLKNGIGSDQIKDRSTLQDIENVKGDETFEEGEGDSLIWNAEGNDIFYEGTTTDEVPVALGISYFLNGQEVQGKDMEGASGEVKIIISYRNTARAQGGTTVPFIAMTGFITDDDSFEDIDIDHGKIIDDGDKKVVVGMAAPGLNDALDIDKDLLDLDLEDTITITGTAKDFAVQDMMTIVTNSIFEDLDEDAVGDLDYDDEISDLDKGAKKLMEGSDQLYQGIDQLYENTPKLARGVRKLKKGAHRLSEGTSQAALGAQQLNLGVKQLSGKLGEQLGEAVTGTRQLEAASKEVLSGLKKMKAGLDGDGSKENPGAVNALDQAQQGLGAVLKAFGEDPDAEALENLSSTEEDAQEVADYVNEINKIVSNPAVRKKLQAAGYGGMVNKTEKMKEAADGVAADLKKASKEEKSEDMKAQDQEDALKQAIAGIKSARGAVKQVEGGLDDMSDSLGSYEPEKGQQQTTLIGGMTVISAGLEKLSESLASATGAGKEMSSGLGALVTGMDDLTNAEADLSGGARQLARGMDQLSGKTGQLKKGVKQLDRGSLQLSQGMSTLYKKGIRKIVDLYRDDLKGTLNDLDDVIDAGKSYKTFTELPEGMDGNVKFIYKTSVY